MTNIAESSTPEASNALRKEVISVGRYSLVYLIGQAVSRAVGFLMIPLYTQYIAPGNYGAMELIEILTGAFLMIISMGVGDSMSRFYYTEKDEEGRNKVISTIVVGFGLLGIPIVLLLVAAAPWIARIVLEEERFAFYLQITIGTAWFGMLCDVGFTYLQMRYMAKTFVAVTLLQLVAALSLNIYFITRLEQGILGVFYSTLITQAATGLILVTVIISKVGWLVSPAHLRKLIGFGLPLVPPQIGLMLGFSSNRFFLRWYGAADPAMALAQVGIFSLGHKFGVIVNRFINVPFNSFWSPRRFELLLRDEPHARETVARMCTYGTLCSVSFALVLSACIAPVVALMAESSYHACWMIVPLVALAYIATGLETHFKTGILFRRKTLWDTWIGLLALAAIIGWNWVFVPRYGLMGAATSNLAGFAVRVTLVYFVSQKLYPIPFEMRRIATMLLVAIGLYFVSQMITFHSMWLTGFARAATAALFPFVLLLVRFYHEGELEFVRTTVHQVWQTKIRKRLVPSRIGEAVQSLEST